MTKSIEWSLRQDWLEAKKQTDLAINREMRNADRYLALKEILKFCLGAYNGPDSLENATESEWHLKTPAVFLGTNKQPESLDAAIDEWIERNAGGIEPTSLGAAPLCSDSTAEQAQ